MRSSSFDGEENGSRCNEIYNEQLAEPQQMDDAHRQE